MNTISAPEDVWAGPTMALSLVYSCKSRDPASRNVQSLAESGCTIPQRSHAWAHLRRVPGVQVYRGTLREGGQPVAVKVQRPGVREQIALDVYILRRLLVAVRLVRKVNR